MILVAPSNIRKELRVDRMILLDSQYAAIDETFLRKSFIPWFKDWCLSSGLNYKSEIRDCDKFVRAFAAQAHFSAWRRQSKYCVALGWMGVKDRNGHALNIARTEKGWVEIEPQTGEVSTLRSNHDSILFIVL